MFIKLEKPNGVLTFINPSHIIKAEFHPMSNKWKIHIVNETPVETDSFESHEAALQWYDDTIRKLVVN